MRRWRGWWRIIRPTSGAFFFAGAMLGMILPAMLYVTFIPRGSDIQVRIAAALAQAVSGAGGALLGGPSRSRRLGAFQYAADQLEGMVPRNHRHSVDGQQPVAQMARRRRARRLLRLLTIVVLCA